MPCSGTLVVAVIGDGSVRSSREAIFSDVPLFLDFLVDDTERARIGRID